jgi:peptidyl-prolyl cis-trans isomerase-like 1
MRWRGVPRDGVDLLTARSTLVAANPIVEIETTKGTIVAELFADKAPQTVANFVDLVNQNYYDGIIFHRVIREFMVQTGDPTGTGRGGRRDKGLPPKKLMDEFHRDLRHDRPGIFSMANSGPNTGDSQIFITTVPCPWLDDKHAVFGAVTSGLDVVKAIEGVPTSAGDRPKDPPKIIKARIKP